MMGGALTRIAPESGSSKVDASFRAFYESAGEGSRKIEALQE